jgi:hypothetical protein
MRAHLKAAAHPCQRCHSARAAKVRSEAGPKELRVSTGWIPATKPKPGAWWNHGPQKSYAETLEAIGKKIDAANAMGSKLWPVKGSMHVGMDWGIAPSKSVVAVWNGKEWTYEEEKP